VQVTQTRGGLYVAEDSYDFQSVARALREYDPELRLVPQEQGGVRVYKVFKYRGDDKPAEFVAGWWDEQLRPLPLSHRLVDEVKRLRPENRHKRVDEDEFNAALREERRRDSERELEALADEAAKRSRTSPVLHRGQHLRRSRHKPGGRWYR
jgi:hypothetical protein